jgi:hypothetical protein
MRNFLLSTLLLLTTLLISCSTDSSQEDIQTDPIDTI